MRVFWLARFDCRGLPLGLGVVAACWAAHQWAELLSPTTCAVLLPIALLFAAASLTWPPGRGRKLATASDGRSLLLLLSLMVVFIATTHWRAHQRLEQRLLPAEEGETLEIIAMIDELPVSSDQVIRFAVRVEACVSGFTRCSVGTLYRLNWYLQRPPPSAWRVPGRAQASPELMPGQRWQLVVRLKQVHATANPGLFDAELRALEDGVSARGYVRSGKPLETLSAWALWRQSPMTAVHSLRWRLREAMQHLMATADGGSRAVVVALVVGDQSAISPTAWDTFNRTGIGHLISISGLHITMLAGIAHGLVIRMWRSRLVYRLCQVPLASLVPAPVAARVAAVLTAIAYSGLAGWGIPAQRTCWMLAAALIASLSNRGAQPLNVVSAALVVVLALDPWAVLAAGFWLSFAAVAAIVWFASGGRGRSVSKGVAATLAEAGRAQLAVSLALVPLGAVFFSSISLISPIANTLAIPLVSFVVTPLALLGGATALLFPTLAGGLLTIACWTFEQLMVFINLLDRFEHAVWIVPLPGALQLTLASIGVAVFLSQLLPGRWMALVTLLPILSAQPARPGHPHEFWLTAIDVGQGMSVLVETKAGRLLFDAGPQYGRDSDAGQRILGPYFRARGIDRLERLVLSHRDADHSGGAPGLWRSVRIAALDTSIQDPEPLLHAARLQGIVSQPCLRGDAWQWAGVRFEWLHPGGTRSPSKRSPSNANSCVLRVSSPAGSALLTGDIEVAQEHELIEQLTADLLRADTLIAPHHGSRTSSSAPFIEAVAPRQVIFQLGYRNRYRHPHPAVWQRYLDSGAHLLRSDWHGAVEIRYHPQQPLLIRRYRLDAHRYWRVCAQPSGCHPGAGLSGNNDGVTTDVDSARDAQSISSADPPPPE